MPYTLVTTPNLLIARTNGKRYVFPVINNNNIARKYDAWDPSSVGDIYDLYFSDIYRYVRYRINDDLTAEDIASDVFVNLIEAFHRKKGPERNLKGWLIATASNAVNDHLRRRYRRSTDRLTVEIPDGNPGVHEEVASREQNRAFRYALGQLTNEQQDVLALRFGLGYSLEETAKSMGKKVNAIKALQFRALSSLQRLIGQVDND